MAASPYWRLALCYPKGMLLTTIRGIERAAQEMTQRPYVIDEVFHPPGMPSLRGSIENPTPSALRMALDARPRLTHAKIAFLQIGGSVNPRALVAVCHTPNRNGSNLIDASISTPIGPPTDRATSETARTATLPPCEMEIEGASPSASSILPKAERASWVSSKTQGVAKQQTHACSSSETQLGDHR